MCDHVQVPPQKLEKHENDFCMLLEPRGTMKTTFCLIGKSVWLLAKDVDKRLLIVSSTHEEAKKRLKAIKEQMERNALVSFFYRELAQNAKSKVAWKAESVIVSGRRKINIEPSIDTAGRGTDCTGNHYDDVLIDDIENDKTVISEEEIANTKRYIARLSPCINPKDSTMSIYGTRWSFGDVYSMIKGEDEEDRGRYDFFRIREKSAYNVDGSLYYPERLDEKELTRQKKMLGNYLFSCNYLNNPVATEDQAFPPANTMMWYGSFVREGTAKYVKIEKVSKYGDPFYEWKEEDEKVQIRPLILVDPALSEDIQACYSAIIVAGKDLDKNRIWVLDAVRLKSEDPHILIKQMLILCAKYDPMSIVIEDVAYQRSIKSYFEEEMKKQGLYIRIDSVGRSDRRSKTERILGLSSFWKSDSIFLPVMHQTGENMFDSPIRALKDELYRFPKSRTLDMADALSRINDVDYASQSKSRYDDLKKLEAAYRKEWQ